MRREQLVNSGGSSFVHVLFRNAAPHVPLATEGFLLYLRFGWAEGSRDVAERSRGVAEECLARWGSTFRRKGDAVAQGLGGLLAGRCS